MTFEASPPTALPAVASPLDAFGAQSMTAPLRDVLVQRPGAAFGTAFEDPANRFLHPVDLGLRDATTRSATRWPAGRPVHEPGPRLRPPDSCTPSTRSS
jgi:hypothetical protein